MPRPPLAPSAPASRLIARRALLGSALALSACGRGMGAAADPSVDAARPSPTPLLRDLAPFPIGTEIVSDQFGDPAFDRLARTQFSQVTAGYELKMEYLLRPDGTFRFDGGDRIAAFCRQNGQRLHGHTLIWYEEKAAAFQPLDGDPRAFGAAYDRYIQAVAGRYRGQAVGWDVVNEPVESDGSGLRACLWSRNLGQTDYMVRAFEQAHQAAPDAILFVNEYDLESKPEKRRTLLKLVETLLARGVPVGGIGNQSHVDIDLAPGRITEAMRDIASLGLPVHVSEFDCTFQVGHLDLRSLHDKRAQQARLYREAMEAFMALPPRQRYAFTLWGVRDSESWLRHSTIAHDATDEPLAFDDAGRPKPAFWALADALAPRRLNRRS